MINLGTTLLSWQQKFCNDQMHFTLDLPYANFNQIWLVSDEKQKNWLVII